MKKLVLFMMVAIFALTGCIDYGLTVKIKKDGSGELIEKLLVSKQAVNMLKAAKPDSDMLNGMNDEEYIAKAKNFGDNIKFKEVKSISTDLQEGYEAVYTFDNVEDLKVSENIFDETIDGIKNNGSMGDNEDEEDEDEDDSEIMDMFTFDFSKGLLSRHVTIGNGFAKEINEAKEEMKKADADDVKEIQEAVSKNAENIDRQLAVAKMFLNGMKIYTYIEFEGDIKESNIEYEKNQIKLFEIDFNKLLSNEADLKELMLSDGLELDQLFLKAKNIDGLTFQDLEEISVKF